MAFAVSQVVEFETTMEGVLDMFDRPDLLLHRNFNWDAINYGHVQVLEMFGTGMGPAIVPHAAAWVA